MMDDAVPVLEASLALDPDQPNVVALLDSVRVHGTPAPPERDDHPIGDAENGCPRRNSG